MKPPQAAKIFETIDEDLAVQILGRMKKKSAADILNLMKPEKAQMFTENFAGYKRSAASTEAKPETTNPQTPKEEEPMVQKP
jgi:flagellar motility protein MotE (MotC chaperone)